MKTAKGFTLIEIIIAITILSTLIATTIGRVNLSAKQADNSAVELTTALSDIEISFGLYNSATNSYPTGLGDTSFVPAYLMPPTAVTGYDSSYGVGGYLLALRTGQAAPNNGYYIATKVTVSGANDIKWRGIISAASKLPTTKFFYNTTAPPATANCSAPAGGATIYTTYWITRY